jgi:hypothetical protein
MNTLSIQAQLCLGVACALASACAQPTTKLSTAPETKPIHVGAPSGPLKLTVAGVVRGSSGTAPLVTTKVLRTGEQLYLVLRATEPANVYVGYCDSARKLTVYPRQGALVVGPNFDTRVPETQDFRVDDNLGLETIFVVASKESLHLADPGLSRALTRAASQVERPPCAAELTMTTEESRRAARLQAAEGAAPANSSVATETVAPPPKPSVPIQTARKEGRPAQGAAASSAPASPTLPGSGGLPLRTSALLPAVPGKYLPRGLIVEERADASVSVETDGSGIAILALTFQHEP